MEKEYIKTIATVYTLAAIFRPFTLARIDRDIYFDKEKLVGEKFNLLKRTGQLLEYGKMIFPETVIPFEAKSSKVIGLDIFVPREVAQERKKKCDPCKINVGGICLKEKERTKKNAHIATGINLKYAHCPINEWGIYVNETNTGITGFKLGEQNGN